jgi:hypothetical protein
VTVTPEGRVNIAVERALPTVIPVLAFAPVGLLGSFACQ